MKTIPQGNEIGLDRGRTLRLPDAAGVGVCCRTGSLWITQENDSRDIILDAGESFRVDRDGLTLVHACADSTLTTTVASSSDADVPTTASDATALPASAH